LVSTKFGFSKAKELLERAAAKAPKLLKSAEHRCSQLTSALRDATRDQDIANAWRMDVIKNSKRLQVDIINDHPRALEMEYGAGASKAPEGSFRSTLSNFSLINKIKQDAK
jgi:hypothetical protein